MSFLLEGFIKGGINKLVDSVKDTFTNNLKTALGSVGNFMTTANNLKVSKFKGNENGTVSTFKPVIKRNQYQQPVINSYEDDEDEEYDDDEDEEEDYTEPIIRRRQPSNRTKQQRYNEPPRELGVRKKDFNYDIISKTPNELPKNRKELKNNTEKFQMNRLLNTMRK